MSKLPSKETLIKWFWVALVGFLVGITLTYSVLKTLGDPFRIDFFTWFSIVSLIVNVILILITQHQINEADKQKERTSAQISIWVEYSKAIVSALSQVQKSKHSKDTDILNNVSLIELTAMYFYGSLNRASDGISTWGYYDTDKKFAEVTANKGMKSMLPTDQENNLGVLGDQETGIEIQPTAKSTTDRSTKNLKKRG